MIDVLIPTFNRINELLSNLALLNDRIRREDLEGKLRILISDNHSADGTFEKIGSLTATFSFECKLFRQSENIGLERNSIFLLSQARASFVMYLGDDDYLPAGYLSYVIDKIRKERKLGAIIPGFSALYADGRTKIVRDGPFEEKKYRPSLRTVCAISNFGHQLSGIVIRKECLLASYTRDEKLRNIYPFIYFVAFNNLRGITYYAPKYKVLVSVDNAKDWKYDPAGLLGEILKNYRILYPESPFRRFACSLCFIMNQPWRHRVGRDLRAAREAFFYLLSSPDIEVPLKIALFFVYPYQYVQAIGRLVRRVVSRQFG